jgi:hypothetical protein
MRIRCPDRCYSAARTNVGLVLAADTFGLAADIMKSEMRGTISERNRDPLNTP